MIIGTAGHIDHGKTALVKALTGTDPDRLAEEKRRGITIDLGYAYTPALGFVDVPGHERFVHTMLAGASGIDAALLVVALTDGVMPQTREHADILRLLGIDQGVVALTKADLAGDRIAEVQAALRTMLAGTGMADAPILPVSALTGQGLTALSTALHGLAPRVRPPAGLARLAVDRAFILSGAGLVVTGTLVAGRIAVDDRLVLSPSGLPVRVRGLHAQNRPAREAEAGQRVALNIAGPDLSKDAVRRGDWVLDPAIHAPTDRLDARIRLLPHAPRALRPETPVHLHLGAAHVMAHLSPLDGRNLQPGEEMLVRLSLDRPIGALARDRLVLRDASATHTIGGGGVIDPFPPRRGGRTETRLSALRILDTPDTVEALRGILSVPPGWTDHETFFRARGTQAAERPAILEAAKARAVATLAITPATLDVLRRSMIACLATQHQGAPDQPGVPMERLRLMLPERLPAEAFRVLVDRFLQERVVARNGSWLCLPSHRVVLLPRDQQLWQAARSLIEANHFRPPGTGELARVLGVPDKAVRAVLKRLQHLGKVIEIAPDQFFLRETVAEMAVLAAESVDGTGLLTAAGFRDRLGNGRRMAILVLEFFDRAGLTIRTGDLRRVRTDRLNLFGAPE